MSLFGSLKGVINLCDVVDGSSFSDLTEFVIVDDANKSVVIRLVPKLRVLTPRRS